MLRVTALLAAASLPSSASPLRPSPAPVSTSGPRGRPSRVGPGAVAPPAPRSGGARPELIDYNPVAAAGAVVTDSKGAARFTVFTDRLIRMEQKGANASGFEDRATLAVMNRNLPVPAFTFNESGGVLTITTAAVQLSYTVGAAFAPSTLSVKGINGTSAFGTWSFGDAFPGNLLGTIRGQDMQSATPLNCTVNAGVDDNGEFNHCEWGLVSRDGWVVYDDTPNFALDENDWWSTTGSSRECLAPMTGTDAANPANSGTYPDGTTAADAGACCALCLADSLCTGGWVFDTSAGDTPNCWPLATVGGTKAATSRTLGMVTSPTSNEDAQDLYGLFHGHDYIGALADFTLISGKTIMVPRYASGIWNSRWYDYSSQDNIKLVDDYASRRIPLDVFVIDMDWHRKNDWSGFTFDEHLYPSPEDAMSYLKALGLGITINIHDASGVNNWEEQFPALITALGLPANSTRVPFNLINASVTYAVEDIVLGALINKQVVDFMWIDWQQGGDAGGMTGHKQNPTFWLNHLRCTDRHRVGDNKRALVLARWGGMGMHRYQVGFSGDVASLSWSNMAYQPYFSSTSSNVLHGFWSHDIEGPPDDQELYTRWIQIGSFSGVMRSHDRGMSAGGCNNNPGSPSGNNWVAGCSTVEPWNVPNTFFEANRIALQLREEFLPYIYTHHRAAFDTGVGLVIPMYYMWPESDEAYAITADSNSQYYFGRSMIFSPVITPALPYDFGPGLANKTTWLPPGSWYDSTTGAVIAGGVQHAGTYRLEQIPLFFAAGAVLPYVPLRSLPVIGLASQQYSFLGFKIVPGASSGTVSVYEDDGVTTAYLTSPATSIAWTTASYSVSASTITVTISTAGAFPELPATRAYQLKLLNQGALASVTVNGAPVAYNRFGTVANTGRVPASNQWYWEFAAQQGGMGPVIDIVSASTSATTTVVITLATPTVDLSAGQYGVIQRAVWGKNAMDLDRSTPASNSPGPASLSVLASTGEALTHFAGNDAVSFAAALANVTALTAAAVDEVSASKSPRRFMAAALLSAGW